MGSGSGGGTPRPEGLLHARPLAVVGAGIVPSVLPPNRPCTRLRPTSMTFETWSGSEETVPGRVIVRSCSTTGSTRTRRSPTTGSAQTRGSAVRAASAPALTWEPTELTVSLTVLFTVAPRVFTVLVTEVPRPAPFEPSDVTVSVR